MRVQEEGCFFGSFLCHQIDKGKESGLDQCFTTFLSCLMSVYCDEFTSSWWLKPVLYDNFTFLSCVMSALCLLDVSGIIELLMLWPRWGTLINSWPTSSAPSSPIEAKKSTVGISRDHPTSLWDPKDGLRTWNCRPNQVLAFNKRARCEGKLYQTQNIEEHEIAITWKSNKRSREGASQICFVF